MNACALSYGTEDTSSALNGPYFAMSAPTICSASCKNRINTGLVFWEVAIDPQEESLD